MDQIMLCLCMHMSDSSLTGDCMQITSQAVVHAGLPCTEDSSRSYQLIAEIRKTQCHATMQFRHLYKPDGKTPAVGRTGDKGHMPLTSQNTWLSCRAQLTCSEPA